MDVPEKVRDILNKARTCAVLRVLMAPLIRYLSNPHAEILKPLYMLK